MSDAEFVAKFRSRFPIAFSAYAKHHLSNLSESLLGEEADAIVDGTISDDGPRLERSTVSRMAGGELFGAPLTQEGVALFEQLTEFLSRPENVCTEGLFRKCGSTERQRSLRQELSMGETVEFGRYSVHDAAFVLKAFVMELPETVLTRRQAPVYAQLLDFTGEEKLLKEQQRTRALRKINLLRLLMLLLPGENRTVIQLLLNLARKVSRSSGRMDESALATCLAPGLFRFGDHTNTRRRALHEVNNGRQLLELMIRYAHELFKPPPALVLDLKADFDRRKLKLDQQRLLDGRLVSKTSLGPEESRHGDGEEVATVQSLCDRQKSMADEESINTATQLASLFAYVQAMPPSKEKDRRLKEFIKHNRQQNGLTPQELRRRTNVPVLQRILKPIQRARSREPPVTPEERSEAVGHRRVTELAASAIPGTPHSVYSLQELLDAEAHRSAEKERVGRMAEWRSTDSLGSSCLEDGEPLIIGNPLASSSVLHPPMEAENLRRGLASELEEGDETAELLRSLCLQDETLPSGTAYHPATDMEASCFVTHF